MKALLEGISRDSALTSLMYGPTCLRAQAASRSCRLTSVIRLAHRRALDSLSKCNVTAAGCTAIANFLATTTTLQALRWVPSRKGRSVHVHPP